MLILFGQDKHCSYSLVVFILKSNISEMHGVAFKTSVPLPPTLYLQVEIPDSHTNAIKAVCLITRVERNL